MSNTIPRRAVSIADAATMYGVSRDTIYAAIRSGELPAKKVGVRWIISTDALANWFANLPDDGAAA